jgi:hypothetical protein
MEKDLEIELPVSILDGLENNGEFRKKNNIDYWVSINEEKANIPL